MNKLNLIIAASLSMPLFSYASIFDDGTLDSQPPQTKIGFSFTCNSQGVSVDSYADGEYSLQSASDACHSSIGSLLEDLVLSSPICQFAANPSGIESTEPIYLGYRISYSCPTGFGNVKTYAYDITNVISGETIQCPPDTNPNYTYPQDTDGNGEPDACFSPLEIDQKDSCNFDSGYSMLNVSVTASQGCYSQPDGSVCMYSANEYQGQQVYTLDLEGDCYGEVWPILDQNGALGDMPTSSECTSDSGLLICPEDPNNVCSSTSTLDGSKSPDCQQGCGEINGQFVCVTKDTDQDGIQDYLDPDIDGDGVKNDDDLDSDGDGLDDPINQNGAGNIQQVDTSSLEGEIRGLGDKLGSKLDDIKDGKYTKGTKGSYDLAAAEASLAQMQSNLTLKIESIKTEAATLFGQLNTSSGSFSACRDIIQFKGSAINKCLDRFSDEMTILSNAILFIFVVLSVFIVLGGLGGKK